MDTKTEEYLDLPSGAVGPGIALHVEASDDIRLVYKASPEDGNKAAGAAGRLQLATCTSTDDLLSFLTSILARCGDVKDVLITGEVSEELKKSLEEKLNVRVTTRSPLNSLVQAYHDLFQKIPTDQLRMKNILLDEDITMLFAERDGFIKVLPKLNEINAWDTYIDAIEPYKQFILESNGRRKWEDKEVTSSGIGDSLEGFPCLLLDLENTTTYIKVNTAGEGFEVLDVNNRALDTLVGIGSLLTGAKDYDALMDLASRGRAYNVHETDQSQTRHTRSPGGRRKVDQNNAYSVMLSSDAENVYFCFGQAVGKGKDDFSAEDLAAALVYNVISDIVELLILYLSGDRSLRHVTVCGSMLRHACARQMFVQEYWRRMMFHASFSPDAPRVPLHILSHAPYYAAYGALIDTEKT